MGGTGHASARDIRARLSHPVVDADGHWLHYGPVFREEVRKVGGDVALQGLHSVSDGTRAALTMSPAERRRRGIAQESFWDVPQKNARDRATAMFPRLLHERLGELGIDYAVIYPTAGGVPRIQDDVQRRAACRAFNVVAMEYFHELTDRLAPAAIIPMHTPDEAIAELEHATELGFKVGMFASLPPRPVASVGAVNGEAARFAVWYDALGLDSAHDYDAVWQRCLEMRIAPTFHTGVRRQGLRLSPTNFTFNHIGHFAAAGHAVCKALFLGGVTRRFPALRIGFLEGGVGWACALFADLIGHWEKRNRKALEASDPRTLDRALLMSEARTHGYDEIAEALERRDGWPDPEAASLTGGLTELDDYAACRIERPGDWQDLFVTPFAFGCEADDRMNAWAFDRRVNPFGARLNAMFGSDISHFDVPDMHDVLPEAYELVEEGLLTADDFRDFTFANAVRLWGGVNPRFFEGTAVEREAAAVLAPTRAAANGSHGA
jgi:predicted TIM-barrel fold metal-dependent hydrolase